MDGAMLLNETMRVAYDSFRTNRVRFALTALGMVIGTASLILVVTIGLTGKEYVLGQIQSIGANMIYAEYESGRRVTTTPPSSWVNTSPDSQSGPPTMTSPERVSSRPSAAAIEISWYAPYIEGRTSVSNPASTR